MLTALTDLLYVISNALLGPVVLLLLGFLAWVLVLAGGLAKEWFERSRVRRSLDAAVDLARRGGDESDVWVPLSSARAGLPQRFVQFLGGPTSEERMLRQAVINVESCISSSIARHSFITRISPMLGLMGTLIPLGPALSGLANGNMQSLAGNLVVAFTATVVGLLISGIAFGMGLLRRTWYARDLTDLEFICDRLSSVGSEERSYVR